MQVRFSFRGEGGIRTRDTVASIQTFQACSFDHSDTSPCWDCKNIFFIDKKNAPGLKSGAFIYYNIRN